MYFVWRWWNNVYIWTDIVAAVTNFLTLVCCLMMLFWPEGVPSLVHWWLEDDIMVAFVCRWVFLSAWVPWLFLLTYKLIKYSFKQWLIKWSTEGYPLCFFWCFYHNIFQKQVSVNMVTHWTHTPRQSWWCTEENITEMEHRRLWSSVRSDHWSSAVSKYLMMILMFILLLSLSELPPWLQSSSDTRSCIQPEICRALLCCPPVMLSKYRQTKTLTMPSEVNTNAGTNWMYISSLKL